LILKLRVSKNKITIITLLSPIGFNGAGQKGGSPSGVWRAAVRSAGARQTPNKNLPFPMPAGRREGPGIGSIIYPHIMSPCLTSVAAFTITLQKSIQLQIASELFPQMILSFLLFTSYPLPLWERNKR
jgi:hypothetical protein